MTQTQIKDILALAEEFKVEPPQPLQPAHSSPIPYPVYALGAYLAKVVKAIHQKTRTPEAICAQSVLAAVSLIMQSRSDVTLPFGQKRPLSNFFLSIAETGERKSSADAEAVQFIKDYERTLSHQYQGEYDQWKNEQDVWDQERQRILFDKKYNANCQDRKSALNALGSAPREPLLPMLICEEPTVEGLCKLFPKAQPRMGVFSTEGGRFIGGYSMSEDNKLNTVSTLSQIWDGMPIKRVRGGDGVSIISGRRVSMHLMIQPYIAQKILSDPLLKNQGFLSRVLIIAPASAAGTRLYQQAPFETDQILANYTNHFRDILELPMPLAQGKQNELDLPCLAFTQTAAKTWIRFHDDVERSMVEGGELEPIRGLANKLPEHAARMAGVLSLAENIQATEIDHNTLEQGITLATYYASEALRLTGGCQIPPDLQLAVKLLSWLHVKWDYPIISLPDIYQKSIHAIKDKSTAHKIVRILEDHRWLIRLPQGGKIKGIQRQEVWRVVQG
jgi:hypothetical protein